MRRWFGVSFDLTPYSPFFLRVIHPSFLCSESQASLYKTPVVLSGRPLDPTVIAAASGREWRPQLPWEDDNGTKVCVCVCDFSAIKALYLLSNCLNTCDNRQWCSNRLQYSWDSTNAAQHGVKQKLKLQQTIIFIID